MGDTPTVFNNKVCCTPMFLDDVPDIQSQKLTFYGELVISRLEGMPYLA